MQTKDCLQYLVDDLSVFPVNTIYSEFRTFDEKSELSHKMTESYCSPY